MKTFGHVVLCLFHKRGVNVVGSSQVLGHKNVRGEVEHVLFTAAVRHLDQRIQAINAGTHQVTYDRKVSL